MLLLGHEFLIPGISCKYSPKLAVLLLEITMHFPISFGSDPDFRLSIPCHNCVTRYVADHRLSASESNIGTLHLFQNWLFVIDSSLFGPQKKKRKIYIQLLQPVHGVAFWIIH